MIAIYKNKQHRLNQISRKNNEHSQKVVEKLNELKIAREKADQDRIVKIYKEQKRKDELLKDLKLRNEYHNAHRSISAFRNRDITYEESEVNGHTPGYMKNCILL